MAKRSNKDEWRKKRRQNTIETREFQYFIFCEGEQTEPLYFDGFKRLIEDNPVYRNMVQIHIEPHVGNTVGIIRYAHKYVTEEKIAKGQIWCVYDKDDFPADDFNAAQHLSDTLSKSNPDLQYHAAWSNECIEYWFILHFAYYDSNNHRSEYIRFLNEKFQELGLEKYQKNLKDIFNILMEKGNPKLAIRYAKKIFKQSKGKNPSDIAPGTRVYELVEELAKYFPEKEKKLF